jgi:hypothetical protein
MFMTNDINKRYNEAILSTYHTLHTVSNFHGCFKPIKSQYCDCYCVHIILPSGRTGLALINEYLIDQDMGKKPYNIVYHYEVSVLIAFRSQKVSWAGRISNLCATFIDCACVKCKCTKLWMVLTTPYFKLEMRCTCNGKKHTLQDIFIAE